MIFRKLIFLLLFVFVMGCAYGRHMDKGNDLYASGQYEDALKEYQEAQKVDPESKEAALKIQITKEKLVSAYTTSARMHLDSNEMVEAIDSTHSAYEKLPDNPIVLKLVSDVEIKSFEKADAYVNARDFASALSLTEHLAEKLPPSREKARAKALVIKKGWVASLVKRAEAAKTAGRKGETLLLYAKATELIQNPELAAIRDELKAELVKANSFNLILSGSGSGFAEITAELIAANVDTNLRRILPKGSNALETGTMSLKLGSKKFTTKKVATPKTIRYQSGTKKVKNPAYKPQQDKVIEEEKRLAQTEKDLQKAESDVQAYQEAVTKEGDTPNTTTGAEQNLTNAKTDLKYRQGKVNAQGDTLIKAKEALNNTPQTIEEPVYTEYKYNETLHTLTVKQILKGVITINKQKSGLYHESSTHASDSTHPANKAAKLEADALELPAKATFNPTLHHDISAYLLKMSTRSFLQWRAGLLKKAQSATTDEDSIDGYVIYMLSDPENVDPIALAEINTLRGIANANQLFLPKTTESK